MVQIYSRSENLQGMDSTCANRSEIYGFFFHLDRKTNIQDKYVKGATAENKAFRTMEIRFGSLCVETVSSFMADQ